MHSHCFVSPFGIDVKKFKPIEKIGKQSSIIHICVVKKLSKKYGIDTLIVVVALLVKERQENDFRLTIAGSVQDKQILESLSEKFGIADKVVFTGFIVYNEVLNLLNQLDIYVNLIRRNSGGFGVAILGANGCGLPVVVSNADDLKEVVKNNQKAACKALLRLVDEG